MKVKDIIKRLYEFNLEAEVSVIAHNRREKFSFTWGGGSEGETKEDCKEVNFYVDSLCQNEQGSK